MSGVTAIIGDGIDIRGTVGPTGPPGADGSGGGLAIDASLAPYNVVGDSTGVAGNGTDNTAGLRAAVTAAAALTTTVTGQDWCYAPIQLPPGVIRATDWMVDTPDVAGGTQVPIRGLEWLGHGRRATEIFFDRASSTTADPRLNTLLVLGNRAIGWSFRRMSFRSLDPDNSFAYFWSRDSDDSALAFPEYGKGAQSDILFDEVEWRGQWNRVIGIGGDQQSNLNSEMRFHGCAVTVDSTFQDAFFHVGMPMYGAIHLRVTGGATGGTWTIGDGTSTATGIAHNANAAAIAAAIETWASVGPGEVTVTAVSDGFLVRFTGAAESIDTSLIVVTTALTGGSAPAIVPFRRPIQGSQFLNYWFTECRMEYGGGVMFRVGRGGNINCISGSYIATGAGSHIFFKLEDEPSHAESTCRLLVQGVRFELRNANHKVIESSWNKGYIGFESCMDSAYSFQSVAATLASHTYDFTTQSLSRGPIVSYKSCELIGYHGFETHASTAVTGGGPVYEDCRFMNNATATGTAAGMVRYSGVQVPYEVSRCHGSSFTRIANSSFAWATADPGPGSAVFSAAGVLSVSVGSARWYNDTGRALTIGTVRASVGTAPTGSSLIVDVNKNGTTIFTTQANRPTIAAAGVTATGTPAVTTLGAGDYLTVDLDQVGSSTPGADLTVQVELS